MPNYFYFDQINQKQGPVDEQQLRELVAQEVEKKVHAPSTINAHFTAIKSFAQYLVDIELLPRHPLKSVRKLNETLDLRKRRRAMTADEVERLLQAVVLDKKPKKIGTFSACGLITAAALVGGCGKSEKNEVENNSAWLEQLAQQNAEIQKKINAAHDEYAARLTLEELHREMEKMTLRYSDEQLKNMYEWQVLVAADSKLPVRQRYRLRWSSEERIREIEMEEERGKVNGK